MHSYEDSFGGFLRNLRKRMGMTQGDLGVAVGYSVSFISALEANRRLPILSVVAEQFIPALGLTDEPRLAARLVELAAWARGETPSPTLTTQQQSHIDIDAMAPSTCPTPPTAILGREQEIRHLCSRLIGRGGRLFTLVGPPGVGKTRLGVELALQVQHLYRDGSYFIPLASIENQALVALEIAAQLAIRIQGSQSPQKQLVAHLRHKKLLLILDNFEQLLFSAESSGNQPHSSAAMLVATILAECPQVCIIVTSRERLHLRAEQRHRVQPLDLAAAVALLVERVQAMDSFREYSDAEKPYLAAICQQLDCLPLAIELAAARLDLMSPATLLAHLQNHRLDLLVDGAVDLPPHQRTLRRAIQGTYALLTVEEQRIFRRLGVFVGGFTLEAAIACGANQSSLAGLIHKNLIHHDTQSEVKRFAMLQTIREFALETLAASDEESAVRHAHARYFETLAQTAATYSQGIDKAQRLAQLEQEHDNLRTALAWTISQTGDAALSFVQALEEFWTTRGYDAEAERCFKAALDRSAAPTLERARGLLALANIERRLGNYPPAADALTEAEAILDRVDEQGPVRLKFHRYSGWHSYDLHDYACTLQSFQDGLALARMNNDYSYIVQFLTALVHIQRNRSELRLQMTAYLDEALALLNELDDPEMMAFVLQQYGGLEVETEHYAAANQYYEQMLSIHRQLDNKWGLAWGLALIGEVAWFQGDLTKAKCYQDEAYRLFVKVENPDGIMIGLHHRAQIARRQGDLDEASAFYRQSIQIAVTLNNRYMLARGLAGLGSVALCARDLIRTALLTAAAQRLFSELPPFLAPPDQQEFAALVAAIDEEKDDPAIAAAREKGKTLSTMQAVTFVNTQTG